MLGCALPKPSGMSPIVADRDRLEQELGRDFEVVPGLRHFDCSRPGAVTWLRSYTPPQERSPDASARGELVLTIVRHKWNGDSQRELNLL
jgi:hypothetical protein